MPITWQNIRYTNPAEASRPMELATQSANNALAPLAAALSGMEKTADYNWQNEKKNYTNDARAQLMGLSDANDFAAAQKDGRINAILSAHGNQIDKSALLDFVDQRGDVLRQRGINDIKYQGVMRDEAAAPHVDALRNAILNEDKVGEAAARAKLSEVGYRNFADQNLFADNRHRELELRKQQDRTADDAHLMTGANIQHLKDDVRLRGEANSISREGVGVQRTQAETARMAMYDNVYTRLGTELNTARQNKAKVGAVSIGSEEGQAILSKALAGLPDPVARQNAAKAAADFAQKNPDAPAAAIASAATAINQRWWMPDSSVRNEVLDNMKALTEAAKKGDASQAKIDLRAGYDSTINALEATRHTAERQLMAGLFPKSTFGKSAIPDPHGEPGGVDFGLPLPKNLKDGVPSPELPTMPYTPSKETGTAPEGIMGTPEVIQAQELLKTLRTNPPKNMTVTDRLLQERNAELIIEKASKQLEAARAAAAARAAPQFDPVQVRKWVEEGSRPR